MTHAHLVRQARLLLVASGMALLCACSSLLPKPALPPTLYTLAASAPPPAGASRTPEDLTLIVNPPLAAAGLASARMVYVRQALQIEHYAHSEWVDTPARMLAPLLVGTLAQRGVARAVVADSSAASGDLRLHTELLRLQQSFESQPSQVQFSLRATLLDEASRQVLAVREFDASAAALSDNPAGGAAAAGRAVQQVLVALAGFCQQVGQQWRAEHPRRATP
ncbi:MAG: membrane integrity-associated transporter subunit PqiC [Burkholderiales bacterium]|nr:membrane integrity-associated transporter subunit PqiC [Burkholderiales bacterium]MBP6405233.1 membrane integrity-associated transporter subunit PqiC [Ramlibacter sp.]